jgi:hypothetical protein
MVWTYAETTGNRSRRSQVTILYNQRTTAGRTAPWLHALRQEGDMFTNWKCTECRSWRMIKIYRFYDCSTRNVLCEGDANRRMPGCQKHSEAIPDKHSSAELQNTVILGTAPILRKRSVIPAVFSMMLHYELSVRNDVSSKFMHGISHNMPLSEGVRRNYFNR